VNTRCVVPSAQGALQGERHPPVPQPLEPVLPERRPAEIAAELREPVAVAGGNVHGRMEVEALLDQGGRVGQRLPFTLLVTWSRGTVVGMRRATVRAVCLGAGVLLASRVEARLPAQLIITCAPKVQCTDRAKGLHRVQISPSYGLRLPVGEAASVSGSKRKAIRRALRFRTREIRAKESEAVAFYAEVATAPSSPVGSFVGTRTLRLSDVEKHLEPIACTLELTVCSDVRLAALGVEPSRVDRLCARAQRRLRRRLGIIAVETPPVTFTVDACPKPKPPKTTTTSSTSSTTTSSSSTTSTSSPG
jgi:hypothetical protein